jgi:electron transfer flavoprotein alpha/beta subunit
MHRSRLSPFFTRAQVGVVVTGSESSGVFEAQVGQEVAEMTCSIVCQN